MDFLQQSFQVRFDYKVFFTEHLFDTNNPVLRDYLLSHATGNIKKLLFVLDQGVVDHHPGLQEQIQAYFSGLPSLSLVDKMILVPGGEQSKNNEQAFDEVITAVNQHGIDRHVCRAAGSP